MNKEGTRLTGLWKNKTKDGKTYLSGSLGLSRLLVLPNDYKRNEKDPDYNVLLCPKENKDKPKNGTAFADPWGMTSGSPMTPSKDCLEDWPRFMKDGAERYINF